MVRVTKSTAVCRDRIRTFLLELLSDFQVSIPEFGTVTAETPPIVILTSNRTRGLSNALKRRCLYLHVEPPEFETVGRKVPELDAAIAAEVCAVAARLREESFLKQPGVAETLDWARAVARLRGDDGVESLSAEEIERTLGCLLKEAEDISRVDTELLERLHEAAFEPTSRGMEAALPYVDALFGFGTTSDLADAVRQLERFAPVGPVGYEHDHRRTDVGWSNG